MRFDALQCSLVALAFMGVTGSDTLATDAHKLTRQGGQLTVQEKDALEEQVATVPIDVESRTKLLGYYFIKGRNDPGAKAARERHVVWLIENAPESEVLALPYSRLDKVLERNAYKRAKQAWLEVLEESPENLAALANAADFFLLHDRKLSEELLLKGKSLDANDPKWSASLGQLYSLQLNSIPSGPARKATAKKAFDEYELAYDRSDPIRRDASLSDLAKTAIEAGLMDKAKQYADKMLEHDADGWNRGNRIHHGNLILGRIALAEGDVGEAKARLILAGRTKGSPQLNSFGPNMRLAKELLEKGEKEVVLEYFELCAKFWTSPRRGLEQWIEDVKADRMPKFGANLVY